MTLEQFSLTLDEFKQLSKCPSNLSPALQALYYEQRGDFQTAHLMVQNASDRDSAWVHAYLHRKENDLNNARFWYKRSGKTEFTGPLQQEWEEITLQLLKTSVPEPRTVSCLD